MSDVDLFGVEQRTRRSISSHETATSSTDEWLTPPSVIGALGSFDLDPCSPGDRRPWDTAAKHYSLEDDGLRQQWEGRVWLNPPYSSAAQWMARLAEHNHGTALIFARTETRMWFDHIWPRASGLLFLKGRLRFCYVSGKEAGTAGAPSVLVAYGEHDAAVLSSIPIPGHYVSLCRRAA
jgi:phage N-6-adenine-methyltransferase